MLAGCRDCAYACERDVTGECESARYAERLLVPAWNPQLHLGNCGKSLSRRA
jgi:hypothetical protein